MEVKKVKCCKNCVMFEDYGDGYVIIFFYIWDGV